MFRCEQDSANTTAALFAEPTLITPPYPRLQNWSKDR